MDPRTGDVLPGSARNVGGDPGIDGITFAQLGLELLDRLPLGVAIENRRRSGLICAELLREGALTRLELPSGASTVIAGCS
jgi:hypothetical protein